MRRYLKRNGQGTNSTDNKVGEESPVYIVDDTNDPTICPNGIDAEVWTALPLDIRKELCTSEPKYKHRKVDITSYHDSSSSVGVVPSMFRSDQSETFCYTDTDFPAAPESIDGREGQSATLLCNCKIPARVRKVHKAGLNQGRLFYSCSKNLTDSGKRCNFFAWAQSAPHADRTLQIQWKRFLKEDGWHFVLPSRGLRSEDVLQGGVGNCWFLSALAVIAERQDLIEAVVQNQHFSEGGSSSFRFFHDGKWRDIKVDNFLPYHPTEKKLKKNKSDLYFSKAKYSQLWVPFVEKAYAKLHGCYEAISGGFISEALVDLTCAPCEVISFYADDFDSEATWERLLSFNNVGFPMGCSTDITGEGIIGNHAYSILDVRHIFEAKLGSQSKIRSFFSRNDDVHTKGESNTSNMERYGADLASLGLLLPPDMLEKCTRYLSNFNGNIASNDEVDRLTKPSELRLIRIRNPWGKQEWSGEMSKSSDLWTTKLSTSIDTGIKNDGTFWMFYHDFLRRFSSIDVCKCFHKSAGWTRTINYGRIVPGSFAASLQLDVEISNYTWVYFFITQPTKRGKSRTRDEQSYWYSDLSIIVSDSHGIIGATFCGQRRDCVPLELHLEAGSYSLKVLHFLPPTRQKFSTSGDINSSSENICLVTYSSRSDIAVKSISREESEVYTSKSIADQFRLSLLQSLETQSLPSFNGTSHNKYLRYRGRNRLYLFSKPLNAENNVGSVVDLTAACGDLPTAHILHGARDIAFVVVYNVSIYDVFIKFDLLVRTTACVISPYSIELSSDIEPHEGMTRSRLMLRIPPVSIVCAATILDNVYTDDGGQSINVALSGCISSNIAFNVERNDATIKIPNHFSPLPLVS